MRLAVLCYIASQLTTSQDTELLRKEFLALDENKDGKLSPEEIQKGYASLGLEVSAQSIMSLCDTDCSGYIDYSEFLTATLNWPKLLNGPALEAAFHAFDKDHSGAIDSADLKKMMQRAETEEESVWTDLLREADVNGDGKVDLREFKGMMMKWGGKSASMRKLPQL